jgi:hypothetical protein
MYFVFFLQQIRDLTKKQLFYLICGLEVSKSENESEEVNMDKQK